MFLNTSAISRVITTQSLTEHAAEGVTSPAAGVIISAWSGNSAVHYRTATTSPVVDNQLRKNLFRNRSQSLAHIPHIQYV